MAVNDPHIAWARFRTERALVKAMHAGRSTAVEYIRSMPGWDAPTVESIKDAAYFLPMVARTVDTFSGLVFLKSPTRTFPEGLEALTDDVTQTGQEIDRFAEAAFDAVLTTGAIGVLVDYPQAPDGLSKADAEAQGYRPMMHLYDADAILEARMTKQGGAMRLTRVRLKECIEEDAPNGLDPFAVVEVEQVRVLELIDNVYVQTIYQLRGGAWTADIPLVPMMAGKPLEHVPMYFSNTRDGEARAEKPPMTDLAEVNIAHLNNSASHEWTLAWLGSPILFGAGVALAEGETLQIGASQGVMAADPTAKLEIVQASADSVGAIRSAMDDKRRDAASLGARMLMETPRAQIAAETARIERAGEVSVVGAIANAVSECLSQSLRMMAKWAGLPETVKLTTKAGEPVAGKDGKPAESPILYWLNTDLLPTRMDPQELIALLTAWEKGALTDQELFAKFQEAEVVDPAKSFEDHEDERIAQMDDPANADAEAAALGLDSDAAPDPNAAPAPAQRKPAPASA